MEVKDIAVLRLNLRARWRLVVNITLRPFYSLEGTRALIPKDYFSRTVFLCTSYDSADKEPLTTLTCCD
jgi:hypothetical protein